MAAPNQMLLQDRPAELRLLNRELGILAFNERVLALSEDPSIPLLERLRYLTIVSNNLDELFEVRVAELMELVRADPMVQLDGVPVASSRASTCCSTAR